MVDKLKLKLENVNPSILTNFKWKEKKYKYKYIYTYMLKNGTEKLVLKLEYIKTKNIYNLIINGSLRKWYYGRNGRRDLSKNDLVKSILKLSKELNIPYRDIVNAKISQIEIGVTIVLKPYFRKILKGLVFYPRLNRKLMYDDESLYFGSLLSESFQ